MVGGIAPTLDMLDMGAVDNSEASARTNEERRLGEMIEEQKMAQRVCLKGWGRDPRRGHFPLRKHKSCAVTHAGRLPLLTTFAG